MGPWIDRIGIVLSFAAFWLVAPELLGETHVRRLQKGLLRTAELLLFIPAGVGLGAIAWAIAFREGEAILHSGLKALAFSVVAVIGLGILYRAAHLHHLPRILNAVSDDATLRRVLLVAGAGLFTLGSALQLAATFLN